MRTAVDWPALHEKVVKEFGAAWDAPDAHAFDPFLGERMEFVQPMLPAGTGPAFWHEEVTRVLSLMPDLRVDVLSWSGVDEILFLHIRFSGTLGGRPLAWDAVDLIRVDPDGTASYRESFFDSVPVAAAVLRRPRAWLPWWRSGVGPLFVRRRFLRPVPLTRPGGTR